MRRVEDERLITGRGRFAGDIKLDGLVHVAFCRSTLPHALVRAIDASAALSIPGVIAVWTAGDLPEIASGLSDWGPEDMESRGRPILNRDEVNYVGEAFALVAAESAYQALDAAESVVAEMDPLPAVGDVSSATASGAPQVHADMKDNIARTKTVTFGDIRSAFGPDAVTAKIRLTTARVAGAAMEPRAVTATPDSESGGLMVWTSTQNVFGVRASIAGALGLDEEKVRVLAEDVGGGFGAKGMVFAEEVLTALVAWRLKRPARWVATRSEDGATTAQGHGSVIELEVASDRDGKLRGLRGRLIHDLGAYAGSGAGQPDLIASHMLSAYVLPAMEVQAQLVYTNTVPTGFIRGGGRPLGNYAMERVIDRLAVALSMSPARGGRGHEVWGGEVAAARMGCPFDKIDVPAGDTGHVPPALLTAGSRSAVQVGNATAKASIALRKKLLERAGDVLEADAADLVLEDGVIAVRGAPSRNVRVSEVVPEEGLEVLESFDPHRPLTFSSGCHACVVAVDPETGQVEVLRYVIAHDTGQAINELIVEGQMHGGYAHGLGYALYEAATYDADGTFRAASFLDYTIVSTGEVAPAPVLVHIVTPTDANPEGFKGAGESGTIPVPAAIANAVEDALRKRRADAVVDRLPITSDRIVEILGT